MNIEDIPAEYVIQQQAFAKLLDIITSWDATVTISQLPLHGSDDNAFFITFQHDDGEEGKEYLPEELEATGEDLPSAIDALQEEIDAYSPEAED